MTRTNPPRTTFATARTGLGRRGLIGSAAALLAAPAVAQQPWPSRPVRMIVAYPAGGSTDIAARLAADRLAQAWGQPVIVENRSGAAGTIGADAVAKSPADGYTLLMAASPEIAIARSTQRNLPYDPVRDFAPIILVAQSPFLLLAHPSVPAKDVKELLALAKARPGTLNFGSFGNGTSNHFVGELLKAEAGIDITHVPYRGSGPMMNDLIAGNLQLAFDTFPAGLPHVQGGRLKALGVAMLRRSPLAPDVATLDEQGLPGFTGGSWVGLVAPARTPEAVIDRVASDMDRIMKDGFAQVLSERGMVPEGMGPAEFRVFVESEVGKWGRVAERAGIRPE
ncbi:Bug family tripartite tricarboxylate transporter substrate binding protein [Elioraea rosea]|uniref:Bug family tripartite tricarboxylate transporter substrate binding protein n=1 Tax=Elioraea rosea TaxID=2492390 RepID=UPI001186A2A4|nr:tripartite tricarboxylate transporter substrate binding protein [Elioraea rosea]